MADKQVLVEHERQELAKVGKKLAGSAEHVKKFADRKLVAHWAKLIEQKRRFGGRPQFQFGIAIDKEKKTIIVPGRTFRSGELSAADMETMIGELQDAVSDLVPLLRERRVVEEARDLLRRGQAAGTRPHPGEPPPAQGGRGPGERRTAAGDFGKPAASNVQDVETEDETWPTTPRRGGRMTRVRQTHFDPARLRRTRACRPGVIDLETTGLGRHDRIVAVGVLADRDAHVLLTEEHRDLSGWPTVTPTGSPGPSNRSPRPARRRVPQRRLRPRRLGGPGSRSGPRPRR